MQLPTNYKMGTGLAATIMGQQAGLEQEKMGLENLYKGMQMPGEILKGQEQAALLNDPNYLQQKTANTLLEVGNSYKANEIQATLNEVGRAKIALQAANGDPKALYPYLEKMGVQPGDPLWQQVDKDPNGVIDKYVSGLEAILARTGGAKQAGAKELTMLKESGDTERAAADREMRLRIAQMQEGGQNARHNQTLGTDKMLSEMIIKANAGDPAAQQWVNTYAQIQRYKNPGFAGATISPTGQLGTKGDVGQLPYGAAGGAGGNRPPLSSFNK